MFFFLAICFFAGAFWLNRKLMGRHAGLVALIVGFAGSMLLYRSPASQTILGWADGTVIAPIAGWVGGWFGEPLPTSIIYGVLCIGGFVVTVIDLWKDHTYNPVAIGALIITPITAHGASSGALPQFIDSLHTAGAEIVATIVGGAIGN